MQTTTTAPLSSEMAQSLLTPEERKAKIAKNKREIAKCKRDRAEIEREIARTEAALRAVVQDMVQNTLMQFAQRAPVSAAMTRSDAVETVMSFLIGANAIPLHPSLCEHLIYVGFDETQITYGDLKGVPAGFADGVSLLKFVGFLHEDAPTIHEAKLLMSIGDNDTQH